ncbi:MAG: alanine racemase [Chloroflexi bacterium]|nr:MAG: alanine racemase [Chloroflexota bacterium]
MPGDALRWAEIDTTAMQHNAQVIKAGLRPETRLMAMVKSNGYGHGATIAARAALAGGATWLGVYTPDEALELRNAGIAEPILVAGWSPPSTHDALVSHGVDIAVFDVATLRDLATTARLRGRRARVHVKVDTGMGRLGVRPEAVDAMRQALRDEGTSIEVAGVFTHFADAESDLAFTKEQHARFLYAADVLRSNAAETLLHTAGSAAILNVAAAHHDMVRLGIALYGYVPRGTAADVALRIAMSVFARVVQLKTVSADETVGYGRTWRASTTRRVATVAIGYGQGVPRVLSNRGALVVGGNRCPIVGIVNMDQVTVDVSDSDGVTVGDAAMFFGESAGVRLGADEVADVAGTIPHEITCGVAASVPRLPREAADRANGGRPTAVP